MAVLETTIRRFVGTSSEDKPELAPRDAGSSYLESDTGVIARWDGRTWIQQPGTETDLDVLREILAEIRLMREQLAFALS